MNDAKYNQFDERGIPTHEAKKEKDNTISSKPINDKLRKKLEKEWNDQDAVYKKWLGSQQK